jgi:hemoglobin
MNTLYERLGGTAGIRELVDSIAGAHLENSRIAARFLPLTKDPAKLEATLGHLRTFMEAGSGGPAEYAGRSMEEAHAGMNVSDEEYMAAIDDVMGALVKHGKDETTQKDVLYILYQIRPTIVRK